MNIEQPTSPPEVKGPTSYYRDQARELAIAEALSSPRHGVYDVYDLIVDAIGNLEEGEYKRLADALYSHAQERACGSGGYAGLQAAQILVGSVIAAIVDDYIMGIPRWQERANDLAWAAWDDDQEGV